MRINKKPVVSFLKFKEVFNQNLTFFIVEKYDFFIRARLQTYVKFLS